MERALQEAVRDRAKHRCEYCHFPGHFAWNGPLLVGRTPIGRATIQALRLSRADAVAVCQILMRGGVYPMD